ncbi:hypothetical protein QBC47DRAFT_380252 [Echria macrotheca]|uniref:Mediator of RNA polymerase II transcription subunit 22 n=1 Tax=Echria macrotheca TaxID=438768 RepID=A0AAJ0F6A1_9PEZI|nr:hypothetical protein QBC47DRAFT_380252 [Echria macrotheca]
MDRDQAASENLLDRENQLIADILDGFHTLIRLGTEKVSNAVTPGQAATDTMAVELTTHRMIKSVEDLLQLTRQLRELWVVGPLRGPGEGDDEAQKAIQKDAAAFFGMMNRARAEDRMRRVRESGGCMTYLEGNVEGNPGSGGPK